MIVQCQQCNTRFRLDDARVTEDGVKVRCSRCRHVFVVRKESEEEVPAQPAALLVEESVTPAEVPAVVAVPSVPEPEGYVFDEPAPPVSADAEDFTFDDIPAPVGEESKPLFEVNYPPQQHDEDDFDFSDFEFHSDEVKPLPAAPEEEAGSDFDFGVFIDSDAQASGKASAPSEGVPAGDFEVVPAGDVAVPVEKGEDDFIFSVAEPESNEPTTDAEAEVPAASAESAAESATSVPEQPVPEAHDEELPPFVVSRRQTSSFFPVVVTAVAVVFVLVMAAAGFYFLKEGPEGFNRLGLGFMAKWFGVEPRAEGRIELRNVEGSFMKNAEAGEVFVIKGEAVNRYKKPRASIQVKGIVYGKGGGVLASRTIYCGNTISPELITALPLSKLEATMNNQFGDSLSNLGVAPGKAIPFVIVLANVPREAVDYGVEVAGSTVASKQ